MHEIILLIAVAVILYVFYKFREKSDVYARTYGSEILVTIGIFFCFAGIAYGLWFFNPNNIDQSIPALIDGIKLSFIASVAGIGASLALKWHFSHSATPKLDIKKPDGATTADMVALQAELNEGLVGKDNKESLVAQFKLFAEKMAENNMKALEKVVDNFNKNLTDQFGENFKKLNEAVKDLLVWQEQYKQELDEVKKAMEQLVTLNHTASESMKKSADNLTIVAENVGSFGESAKDVEKIITTMDAQIKTMGDQSKHTIEAFEELQKIAPILKSSYEDMKADHEKQFKDLRDSYEKHFNDYTAQLQRALDTFEKQVVSISGKFTDDYGPLIDEMRRILTIAKKIDRK